jgi:hypothetical protein
MTSAGDTRVSGIFSREIPGSPITGYEVRSRIIDKGWFRGAHSAMRNALKRCCVIHSQEIKPRRIAPEGAVLRSALQAVRSRPGNSVKQLFLM